MLNSEINKDAHAVTPPPGSSFYYSVLYCDSALREKINALRAFYTTLREIPLTCQNTELAHIKFEWWRNELKNLTLKKAEHPLTKRLSLLNIQPILLETLLEAFIEDAHTMLYETETALTQFYIKTAGLLEKTLGELYGICNPDLLQFLESLGIFIQKITNLVELRRMLSRGKVYFSGEQLISHHVNLYTLSQFKHTPDILSLFQAEAQKIRSYYKKLDNKNPTTILANIQQALLHEIEQSGFPLLTQKIHLTPLRKWWIAFRS